MIEPVIQRGLSQFCAPPLETRRGAKWGSPLFSAVISALPIVLTVDFFHAPRLLPPIEAPQAINDNSQGVSPSFFTEATMFFSITSSDWISLFRDPESATMVMVMVIGTLAVIGGVVIAVTKSIIRHRERMAMIERGMHPDAKKDG